MSELEKTYHKMLQQYDVGHRKLKYLKREILKLQKILNDGKTNQHT